MKRKIPKRRGRKNTKRIKKGRRESRKENPRRIGKIIQRLKERKKKIELKQVKERRTISFSLSLHSFFPTVKERSEEKKDRKARSEEKEKGQKRKKNPHQ